MADFSAEGFVRVDYVASIPNISAPVAATLNAGTPLSLWLTPDGWNPTVNQNSVDTSSLASTYDTSVPGTEGGPITLTLKRSNIAASDTAWNLFKVPITGFLVAREGIAVGTAYSATQKVQVYPGANAIAQPAQTGKNAVRTFTVTWYVSPAPDRDATVA